MDDSQVKAIKQNANHLAELIRGNLTLIANDLKGLQLLGNEDYDRIVNTKATPPLERASDLVQCVITPVKIAPTLYQDFYNVLENYLNPQVLVKLLPKPKGESCYTAWSSGILSVGVAVDTCAVGHKATFQSSVLLYTCEEG